MKIETGLKIGFFDTNGIELCLDDNVKVTKRLILPNEDGWGRHISTTDNPQFEIKSHIGQIVYVPTHAKFQIEIFGWAFFDLIYFDTIEKIIDK